MFYKFTDQFVYRLDLIFQLINEKDTKNVKRDQRFFIPSTQQLQDWDLKN